MLGRATLWRDGYRRRYWRGWKGRVQRRSREKVRFRVNVFGDNGSVGGMAGVLRSVDKWADGCLGVTLYTVANVVRCSADLLVTYATKRTPAMHVQFTPRNLCLMAGPYVPESS